MQRYVAWQNTLLTPNEMRAARFLEIPCLHQVGCPPPWSLHLCRPHSTMRVASNVVEETPSCLVYKTFPYQRFHSC